MVTRPSSASSEKTSSTTCSHHLETERPQQRRSALREISSHRPRICQLGISWNGEREFMYYRKPSADMLLTPSELNLELIRKVKIFHYGSISLIVESCRSAHIRAMEVAMEA